MEDYASAVGLLVIYWATLENCLIDVTQSLLDCDDESAHSITSTIDKAVGRAMLIKRLCHRKSSPSDEWRDCLSGFCDRIANDLSPLRNRFVHDEWFPTVRGIIKRDRKLKIQKAASRQPSSLVFSATQEVDITEIYVLTDAIVKTMVYMQFLGSDYRRWKHEGRVPHIPEQAIRLSKRFPPEDPQPES